MIEGLDKGIQAWRVLATEYLNETQQLALTEARETINVDTGAAARSLEVLPARELGREIVSEYNAGDASPNPKSLARGRVVKTSVYVPILERRFQSVITPHRQRWLAAIQRGFDG